MSAALPHICVCVCTFKRPDMLKRLLDAVRTLDTGGRFTFSVVVADNDAQGSASPVVEAAVAAGGLSIKYGIEPRQNIALARNKACALAEGDYLAWIDDDEFPTREWLLRLLETCEKERAQGALGPVLPHFDEPPPRWLVKGKFCDRPRHSTGFRMGWPETRTGNVLINKKVVDELDGPFSQEFHNGGEDQDFFRRAMQKGHVFVWCDEGGVFETVVPARWQRRVMLRRALLRGRNTLKHSTGKPLSLLKSCVAVPIYLLGLPLFLLLGQHVFMRFMIKFCDHLGRLLAAVHLNPVSER